MVVGAHHRVEDEPDVVIGDVLVEEVGHRVDEDQSRPPPPQRQLQARGPDAQVEALLERVARNAAEALGERLGVADGRRRGSGLGPHDGRRMVDGWSTSPRFQQNRAAPVSRRFLPDSRHFAAPARGVRRASRPLFRIMSPPPALRVALGEGANRSTQPYPSLCAPPNVSPVPRLVCCPGLPRMICSVDA
jgi:hypothetical protein